MIAVEWSDSLLHEFLQDFVIAVLILLEVTRK